jgi:predicted DNA-binding protein (MmcQ/YjbR family)
MNAERVREFLLGLPNVVETAQWGGIVFWVGDKAIGGKMMAMVNPDPGGGLPISYPAGQERMAELVELEGIRPAPYMARIFWVAVERWDVFRTSEWESELRAAHTLTLEKLPPKAKKALAMSKSEQKKVVAEQRRILAAKDAAKKSKAKAS